MQLVSYEAGQKFGLHHDLGIYDPDEDTVAMQKPARLVSIFVYLTDLPPRAGGCTGKKNFLAQSPLTLHQRCELYV